MSVSLLSSWKIILAFGNYLNGSTPKGGAYGFKLHALNRVRCCLLTSVCSVVVFFPCFMWFLFALWFVVEEHQVSGQQQQLAVLPRRVHQQEETQGLLFVISFCSVTALIDVCFILVPSCFGCVSLTCFHLLFCEQAKDFVNDLAHVKEASTGSSSFLPLLCSLRISITIIISLLFFLSSNLCC